MRCDGSRFATEAEALDHLKSLTGKKTKDLRDEKRSISQRQLQTRFKMYMESLGCRTVLLNAIVVLNRNNFVYLFFH